MMVCFEADEIVEMINLIFVEEENHGESVVLTSLRRKLERALYDEEG